MAPPDPSAILNSASAAFNDSIAANIPLLLTWAQRVLSGVVFVGFGYAMLQAWQSRAWLGALMNFAWAVARIAVIIIVFQNFLPWSGAITDLGTAIGSSVSGVSTSFGPSDVFALGGQIVTQLRNARHFGTWFNHPVDDLFFLLLLGLTEVTWFGAALIYLWVFLEAKWIVAAGTIPVAFSAFDHTYPTLENYFVTCLQAGMRLLAVMLVMAVGITLSHGWIADLNSRGLGINTDQFAYGLIQLIEAVLLFYAMWSLPKKASQIVTSRGGGGVYEGDGEGAAATFALTTSAVSRAASAGVNKALRAAKGE